MGLLLRPSLFAMTVWVFWFACDAAAQSPSSPRSVESFIYIDEMEVRHEILIPLNSLESLIPIQTGDPATLTVAEQKAAEESALDLLDSLNEIRIDGLAVSAVGGKIVFFDRAVTNIVGLPPEQDLPARNAIAGIILRYETKGAPQRVALRWSAFNEIINAVPAVIYFDDKESKQVLSPTEAEIEWIREGGSREAAIAHVPTPERSWFTKSIKISNEQAEEIFSALLKNIYRAFDYHDESDIYDALDQSVTSEMIPNLYLNIRRGLEIEAEGGPSTRILEVEVFSGELEKSKSNDSFLYAGEWTVKGSVEHWGHIHTRKNLYKATFTIKVADGTWKISEMRVHKQERLETKMVRRGEPESEKTP